jgi:hypothetical protein
MNRTTRAAHVSLRPKLTEEAGKAHMPCVGAHVFTWADLTAGKRPPEGLSCNCGMFELHYGTCACGCGSLSMSLGWQDSRAPGCTEP